MSEDTTMIEAAVQNVADAKQGLNDPKSLWYNQHGKVDQLERETLAILAGAGLQPPAPKTPQEMAVERVERRYEAATLQEGSAQIIQQRMEALANLSPGDYVAFDQATGTTRPKTNAEVDEMVTSRLTSMPQAEFDQKRAEIIRDLGERRYHAEGQGAGQPGGFVPKTEAELMRLGTEIYNNLIARAANAPGVDPRGPEFAALVSDLGTLKLLADIGGAAHYKQQALDRVGYKPTATPVRHNYGSMIKKAH